MDKTWKKEHGFFKFFIPKRSAKRLKIPTAYTRYKKGNLPATVFLRDRYGNLWTVDINEIQNELFFVRGWSKFVQENSLETGDFLVFEGDGSNIFEVKILGSSCCEKVGVGGPKTQVKEDEQEYLEGEEEEQSEVEDIEEEEKDKESSECTGKDVDEYYINVEDANNDDSKSDFDDDDYDYEDEEPNDTSKKPVVIPESRGCGHKDLKKIHRKINYKSGRGESSAAKDKGGCKRLAAVTYATEIFKSGCISPPKNPYFVTKIRRKRRDELYVPIDVIKDYNLDLPSEMILRDSDRREWLTKLTPWKDGRTWYYGGWASLCRVNHVQETDTCICEFVKREDERKFDLQVTIFRNE